MTDESEGTSGRKLSDSRERRVAIVTGASQGLGRSIALELAKRGVSVAASSRRKEACEEVVAEISASGGRAEAFACDVAERDEVDQLVQDVVTQFGQLDILVNNAGVIEPIARIGESDPEAWEQNIRVNLLGPFHAIQAVLPHFESRGGGVIVNISSGAAHRPREGWSAYSSAKAALAMLTSAIAEENQANGILAFGFQPGVVDTEMQAKIRASGVNEVSRIPREQLAAAEKPARLVAMLCTNPPLELNGQDISIRDAETVARIVAGDGGRIN